MKIIVCIESEKIFKLGDIEYLLEQCEPTYHFKLTEVNPLTIHQFTLAPLESK